MRGTQGASGSASLGHGPQPVMRTIRHGPAEVLLDADSPRNAYRRSPWQRGMVVAVLVGATLLLSVASLATLTGGPAWAGPCPGAKPYKLAGRMVVHCLGGHPLLEAFGGPVDLGAITAVGVAVPLMLAVRYPLLGWRIGWLGLLLVPLSDLRWRGGLPWGPVQILVLLVLQGAAGTRQQRAALGWLCALTLIPWWFWTIWRGSDLVTAALGSVAFLALAVAADTVGARDRARRDLADRAEQTELERARRVALEERARIARELHDVVAHHMSLMAIRAESAPHRLGTLPEPVRDEFGALSGAAREALADMRRLLGVLRSDEPSERAPQPGLQDLSELIDSARQAGMTVELITPAAPDPVPPGPGVCAYRIIQEALSNARRHAPGAPVAVWVDHDAGAVRLQVTNGPGAPAGPRANGHGPGHGLAGMRERAELLGGSLSAGSAPDGGFAVSAVLPLSGAPA